MSDTPFEYYSISVRGRDQVESVLLSALPRQVGLALTSSGDNARASFVAHGFNWELGEDTRGFTVVVTPEAGGKMTVAQAKEVEKLLSSRHLAKPALTAMPYATDPAVGAAMWERRRQGQHWSSVQF